MRSESGLWMRRARRSACCLLAASALSSPAGAQSIFTWIAPAGGAFDDALNWSRAGGPPGPLDLARFLAPGSATTVTFAGPRTNFALFVGDADVTLQLRGHTYSLAGGSPTLSVFTSQQGGVRISNGTLAANDSVIDSDPGFLGAAGAVHVLPGAAWTNGGHVIVGDAGHGVVTLSPLSSATSQSTTLANLAGSDTDFFMQGPSTTWTSAGPFVAGGAGAGLALISGGARLQSQSGVVASAAQSAFNVILDGVQSQWDMTGGPTTIGGAGDGMMRVRGGAGVLSGPLVTIAEQPGSRGRVFIDGHFSAPSTWSIGGDMHVGLGGDGSLTLTNFVGLGGTVITGGFVSVGSLAGSEGLVELLDLGTVVAAAGMLVIGDSGQGAATVRNGAAIFCGGAAVARQAGSTGQIVVDGGGSLLSGSGGISVGAEGEGEISLLNGAALTAPEVIIGAGGSLYGSGVVNAQTTNGGLVSPGASDPTPGVAGQLTIGGAYAQSAAGELEIQLGGQRAGAQFDVLAISGPASLGGALHVTLIDGFKPLPAQQFTILTASSVSGRFGRVVAPEGLSVVYDATQVRLVMPGPCAAADLNCDGHIDGIDLAALLAAWTGSTTYRPCPPFRAADLNHDCQVNGLDLGRLLAAWTG